MVHYGFASRKQPPRVGVTLGIADVENNIVNDFVGGVETKRSRIADVEADDFVAQAFEFERFFVNRPANIVFERSEPV